jgi:cytochrome P450
VTLRFAVGEVAPLPLSAAVDMPPRPARPSRHLFLPFGGGGRGCLGEALFRTYVRAIVPIVLRSLPLTPVWPVPERMVLRGTILVPHRGALAIARAA